MGVWAELSPASAEGSDDLHGTRRFTTASTPVSWNTEVHYRIHTGLMEHGGSLPHPHRSHGTRRFTIASTPVAALSLRILFPCPVLILCSRTCPGFYGVAFPPPACTVEAIVCVLRVARVPSSSTLRMDRPSHGGTICHVLPHLITKCRREDNIKKNL
jgi:hypothetical protein